MNYDVAILLATYNGSKFLIDQIDSLLSQSYSSWKLYISDNGSTDTTLQIIENYCTKYPDRIFTLNNNSALSAKANFSFLLHNVIADYYFFCDQDDFWFSYKLEITLHEMNKNEKTHSSEIPILVHTDLTVTDKNLKIISPSYWEYQNIDPSKTRLSQLLVQNVVTGCTVVINKALRDIAIPVPNEVIMHDWWLALVASSFGYISCIKEPTIYYRQHGLNDVGAKRWDFKYIQKRFREQNQIKCQLLKYQNQAKCLLDQFSDRLNTEQLDILYDLANLSNFGKMQKIKTLMKHRLYKHGIARNVGTFLYV